MDYSITSNPISPTDVNLREFDISGTQPLIWPFAGIDGTNTIARIMIIDNAVSTPILQMPPANQGQLGYTTIIMNLSGNSFAIQDVSGGAIDTINSGQVKIVSLRTNATLAGTWISSTLGATTSVANAALLAGAGLTVLASTLNSYLPSSGFSATQNFSNSDRATFRTWTGGVGVANFSPSATLTNGWWMAFRNIGTGSLTLTPTAPDLIDGVSSEALNPGDACFVICDGAALYTVGIGRSLVITDSQLVKNVAGGVDVTLTPSEYSNNIMNFTGAITANINIIFPNAVKNYWLRNNTTGAFTLTAKTAAGAGVVIPQAGAAVVTCDGTNIDTAQSSNAGSVTSIAFSSNFTGGTIVSSGSVDLSQPVGLVPGNYGSPTAIPGITVDAFGRITAIADNALTLGTASAENMSRNVFDDTTGSLAVNIFYNQILGTNYTYGITDWGKQRGRGNTGSVMVDTLPTGGVIPNGWYTYIWNQDVANITVNPGAGGTIIWGSASGPLTILPNEIWQINLIGGSTFIATLVTQSMRFPAFASKSDMQAATNTTEVVNPAQTQNHPGVAKMWVSFDSSGTILDSYNVASVVKNSTGNFTITMTTPFASANYAILASIIPNPTSIGNVVLNPPPYIDSQSASQIVIQNINFAGTNVISAHDQTRTFLVAYGNQ